MAQLRRDHDQFVEKDVEVIAIGPEGAEEFSSYWAKHNLPFTGLPDPNKSVLKLYGQQFKLLKLGRMPAQIIVDKSGMVRYIHYGQSMQDIPDNSEILELLSSFE